MAKINFPDTSINNPDTGAPWVDGDTISIVADGVTIVYEYKTQDDDYWWKSVGTDGGGSGSDYILPVATDSVLGGIKVGARLEITADGVLSADIQGGGGTVVGTLQEVTDEGNTTDNDIKIGGTLPASPNITLNADGSATLASGEVEVTTAGRLGLGTDSPKGLLHLEGDSIAETWFTATGDGGSEWRIGAGDTVSGLNGGFRIYNEPNSISAISALPAGNVGIGRAPIPASSQPLVVEAPADDKTYVSLRSNSDTGIAGLSFGSPSNPTYASARYLFSDDSYGILVAGSGTESFRISSDGKIFSQFGTGVGGTAAAPNITLSAEGRVTANELFSNLTRSQGAAGNWALFETTNTGDSTVDSTVGFYSAYSAPNKTGGQLISFLGYPKPSDAGFTNYTGFGSNVNTEADDTPVNTNLTAFYDFKSTSGAADVTTHYPNATFYGYYVNSINEQSADGSQQTYSFYSAGGAPIWTQGSVYIGGTVARNTRQLWESLLTEEQKEQLEAGTLAIPADVSTPGDGTFARQWWYNQQSAEDQALIDSGELAYPEHLQAANFTDTFALGDNTLISLSGSNGEGKFRALDITTSTGLKTTPPNDYNNYSSIRQNAGGANDYGLNLLHYGVKDDDTTDFWRDAGIFIGGQNESYEGRIRFFTSRDPGAEEYSYNGAWEPDGSLTVGGTATGNNPTIKLSTDGTIQAANLTDGVTTKTMTEVLAGGSGAEGSAIIGTVNSDGSKNWEASGFESQKTSTGTYQITFDAEQPDTDYVVVATAAAGSGFIARYSSKTTTGFAVAINNTNANVVDSEFSFIVTSPTLVFPEVFSVPGSTYEGIQGQVAADGSKVFGEGWDSTKSGGGSTYTITFDEALPDAEYTVLVSLVTSTNTVIRVTNQTETGFTVYTAKPGDNSSRTSAFNFAVMPSDLSGDSGFPDIYAHVYDNGTSVNQVGGVASKNGGAGKYKFIFDEPFNSTDEYIVSAVQHWGSGINVTKQLDRVEFICKNQSFTNENMWFDFAIWKVSPTGNNFFYLDSDNNRYYLNQQFTYNGVIYPKQSVTDDLLVNTLGFTRVQVATKPYLDPQYYSVTGPNDDGSWTTAQRDLAEVKDELVKAEKLQARALLSKTDWLVIRHAENSNAIPVSVATFRDNVRVISDDRCVAIYAAASIADLEQLMNAPEEIDDGQGAFVANPDALSAYPEEIDGYDY